MPAPWLEGHSRARQWTERLGCVLDEEVEALAAQPCLTAACAQARWCRKCLAWHAAQSGDGWLEEARGALYFTSTIKVGPYACCFHICTSSSNPNPHRLLALARWFIRCWQLHAAQSRPTLKGSRAVHVVPKHAPINVHVPSQSMAHLLHMRCLQPGTSKCCYTLQVCMCVDGNVVDITELAKCNGLMYEADGITMVSQAAKQLLLSLMTSWRLENLLSGHTCLGLSAFPSS